ncbi:hypothetical protein HZB03_00350 [Candidatus Woesearchaeota archaeon]|nr:hypothetical protein [Candidatus Woesearchaeota archaeon]
MDNYSFIPTRGKPHRGMSVIKEHSVYHELGVVVSERGVDPRGAGSSRLSTEP